MSETNVLLRTGFMPFQEIAEWAKITYDSFRHKERKQKIMDALKFYCKYDIKRGGIDIKEIYINEAFDNKFNEDVEFFFKILFQQPEASKYEEGLAYIGTLKELAEKHIDEYNELRASKNIKPCEIDTLSDRLGEVCNMLFSKNKYKSSEMNIRKGIFNVESGPYGWKQGQLLIKENGTLRELNKEDWELFFKILEGKDYECIMQSQVFVSKLAQYCAGDHRSAEDIGRFVQEYMDNIRAIDKNFGYMVNRFREKTGNVLIRGTVWILKFDRGREVKLLLDEEE